MPKGIDNINKIDIWTISVAIKSVSSRDRSFERDVVFVYLPHRRGKDLLNSIGNLLKRSPNYLESISRKPRNSNFEREDHGKRKDDSEEFVRAKSLIIIRTRGRFDAQPTNRGRTVAGIRCMLFEDSGFGRAGILQGMGRGIAAEMDATHGS